MQHSLHNVVLVAVPVSKHNNNKTVKKGNKQKLLTIYFVVVKEIADDYFKH